MQNAVGTPAESAGGILSGLALQQRERETALQDLARLRKEASAEIDRLIAFLDASDEYVRTELEDDDDREHVGDDEYSLGFPDRIMNQARLAQGNGESADEGEIECEDEGAQCDDEGVTA